MPGEFFDDRELERDLLDEFPTPLADVYDDLTYERAPRGRLAKVIDLFRVSARLLAIYALAGTAEGDLAPEALNRLRKLVRQRLSEGDWIGIAREAVRPFARTPAPFPLPEVASVFFRPGTEQAGPGAAALERLLKTRNEWAHGVSGTEAEVEAIVQQCRPDLETVAGLIRWMADAPWFVPEESGGRTVGVDLPPGPHGVDGRRLAGTTPRRGFRVVSVTTEAGMEPGEVYAMGPAGPLRLSPLVLWLAPAVVEAGRKPDSDPSPTSGEPELFLLESGGRREARLQAFPSGREIGSAAALEWLCQRTAITEEPEEREPRFDVPMIDRQPECEHFRRLLRRVMEDRQGQVLVIEGEAGIGKTKFSRFCREATTPLPVRVMSGSYRDDAGGPYAGFREALEDLFGIEMLERDAVAARIRERLPELGYTDRAEAEDLAGFMTQFLRPLPGAAEPGREGLDYVVDRMVRFLRRASLHVPLMLLLEDLHWADAESIVLLQHLTALMATDPARLLIISSMRAGDREPNPALEAALQKMARFEGTFYRRSFERLGEDDTALLIVESLQSELEDKAAIYHLAEGNPLHVLSILRYLHSEQLLEETPGGWRVRPGVQLTEILPPTVREVIGLRVQRLVTQDEEGPRRREALFWAGVAGRRFDVEVLADAVSEGAPELAERLDSHLDALVGAGLLRECPDLPGDVLEFDHHLLREVVLDQQEGPRAERARHRAMAHAKLRRVERGNRSLLPEVAHHFVQAREWAQAVRHYWLAGDAAIDTLAYREAAGLYETALRLLREQPGVSLSDEEWVALHTAHAEALETLGRMEEALAAHRAAQSHTDESRVLWARSERSIAWLLSREGQLDEAVTACERAREVLEAEGAEIDLADVLRTLGVVEILRGHFDVALGHVQRALAIYQQAEHLEGVARCYDYLAQIYQDRGDPEAMLDATQRSRAIAEALGHPIAIGHALNNVAYALIALGRHGEALPLLFRATEVFERHHIEKYLPSVYHSLAEALLSCDRCEEAGPYLERGLDSANRMGHARTVANFHCLMARQALASDRPEEARQHYEEALQLCERSGLEPQQAQISLAYGEFLADQREFDAAVRRFEEALAIRRRLGGDGTAEAEEALQQALASRG